MAEAGNKHAQSVTGKIHWNGIYVTKHRKKSVHWYRKAAGQGDALALYNLAVMYRDGEGVTKNGRTASIGFAKQQKKAMQVRNIISG